MKQILGWTTCFLGLLFILASSCAPVIVGPGDQNSSLVVGRVVINNNYPGHFYGVLPQGTVDKNLDLIIESKDGKQTLSATTGEHGYFFLANVQPNNYYLRHVTFGNQTGGFRERKGQEVRRLDFTPVPARVLYVGTLFIDISERGFATLRETNEEQNAKTYFTQTYSTSPWISRAFVGLRFASTAATQAPPIAPDAKLTVEQAPTKVMRPEWRIGNQWRYSWKTATGSGTLTREIVREEPFAGVPSYVVRVGKSDNFYTKETLGLLGTKSGGKVTLQRNAPFEPLSWPLEVGMQWENSFTLERLEEKSSENFTNRFHVINFETVTVPAGTYEAFKIELYSARSGNLSNQYWYAPEVKWFAKTRSYSSSGVREEELLSYKID